MRYFIVYVKLKIISSLVTRKVLHEKILSYSVLNSSKGKIQESVMKNGVPI